VSAADQVIAALKRLPHEARDMEAQQAVDAITQPLERELLAAGARVAAIEPLLNATSYLLERYRRYHDEDGKLTFEYVAPIATAYKPLAIVPLVTDALLGLERAAREVVRTTPDERLVTALTRLDRALGSTR
jgi:hypothetical protein